MRRLTSTIATGAVALLAAAAPAAASAAEHQTLHCGGTSDGCGVTIPIAHGAKHEVVTVKLTDTNLRLASITSVSAVKNGYEISKESYRDGGSEFRFTLDAKESNPKRARLVLVFSDPGDPPPPGQGITLQGGWKWFDAVFKVPVGLKVTITGGGDGTSICTREETSTTFVTTRSEQSERLVYYSKGDGGCAMQLSYSQFKVQIRNSANQLIASGRLFYGQKYVADDYVVSCSSGPWAGAGCQVKEAPGGGPGALITMS
ncbi:MAG TPA: hypothetical protein VGM91_17630 [Conexibacter sp.]|jgi:hypothetical protein